MSGLILPLSFFAYFIIPAWMMSRGWIVAAGLAMIGIALLPWILWISVREDLSGPGTGMVMLLSAIMVLIALIPIAIGAARAVQRLFRRKPVNGS
jgi:hypothetical protein